MPAAILISGISIIYSLEGISPDQILLINFAAGNNN